MLYVKEESVSIKGSCSESEKSGSENNPTSGRLFPLCLLVFSFCYDYCYRYFLLSCVLLVVVVVVAVVFVVMAVTLVLV